jgi:hypothetical protein
MPTISDKAALALRDAVAQSGKHKGMLKAKAPPSTTLGYAAWQGAMLVCNPFKVSIPGMMFMTEEQRDIMREIEQLFEELKVLGVQRLDRDRSALERIGAW